VDDWEAAFRDKSERRRRRARRNRLIRRGALLALISALILLGLWTADTVIDDVLGWL
jgi:hypothetical protein